MKGFVLTFLFAVMMTAVSGCLVSEGSYVAVDPVAPATYVGGPVYVYTYPDGGCWADGVWYAQCRWVTGPHYGHYHYSAGAYVHHPGITWGQRHDGYPPPWHGHHYTPPQRYVPPPYYGPHHQAPPSRRGPPPSHRPPGRHGHDGRRF